MMTDAILIFAFAVWAIPALVLAALFFLPIGSPAMNRRELGFALFVVLLWPIVIVGGVILDSYGDRQRCSRDVWP